MRASPDGLDSELLALELGRIAQRLGDYPAALEHYEAVIAANAAGDLARRARLNRARIELELGPSGRARAWADYERLVAEDPADSAARLGHALVALRTGRPDVAEADLTRLLDAAQRMRRRNRRFALNGWRRGRWRDSHWDERPRPRATPTKRSVSPRPPAGCGSDFVSRLPRAANRNWPGSTPTTWTASPPEAAPSRPTCRLPPKNCEYPPKRQNWESTSPVELSARMIRAALLSALGNHAEALAEADRAVALDPSRPRCGCSAPGSAAARPIPRAPWPTSSRASLSLPATRGCRPCAAAC